MPKQNRVTPFGDLIATTSRGTMMGNRGCLHDKDGNVTMRSARRAWVTCLLEFNDRKRQVMSPGQYTELFFLDEATALAAGHRPCATCQRDRFKEFKSIWARASENLDVALDEIDGVLLAQRLASGSSQSMWRSKLSDLPDGVMVIRAAQPQTALLLWKGQLFPWTPAGYLAPSKPAPGEVVSVITPQAVCSAMSLGFLPKIHPSVRSPIGIQPAAEPAAAAATPMSRAPTSSPAPTSSAKRHEPAPAKAQPAKPAKKTAPKQVATPGTGGLFRLAETPRGGKLYAYFAAILEVTGMSRGSTFPLQKFVGNFSGHVNAGRIEKVSGGYRLTPAGMSYFADRFTTWNPQHVSRSEVDLLVAGIKKGGTGWSPL